MINTIITEAYAIYHLRFVQKKKPTCGIPSNYYYYFFNLLSGWSSRMRWKTVINWTVSESWAPVLNERNFRLSSVLCKMSLKFKNWVLVNSVAYFWKLYMHMECETHQYPKLPNLFKEGKKSSLSSWFFPRVVNTDSWSQWQVS